MNTTKQVEFINAYAQCEPRFTKYCTALTYGKMDAADLIQDVLLTTYEQFDKINQKDQMIF